MIVIIKVDSYQWIYIRLCVYYNTNRVGTSVNDSYQQRKNYNINRCYHRRLVSFGANIYYLSLSSCYSIGSSLPNQTFTYFIIFIIRLLFCFLLHIILLVIFVSRTYIICICTRRTTGDLNVL